MPEAPRVDAAERPMLREYVRALRPRQWTKNSVVLAAFFFAFWDRSRATPLELAELARVIPAMLLFCVVSSGIYVLNDIRDIAADRHHPVKCRRPIAAGRIPIGTAWALGIALLLAGLIGSYALAAPFGATVGGYVALQLAYSLWLKRIALADILVIAGGFVLRAIAGAMVLHDVTISPWLLLCTFLLALFLALCKRRHEKRLAEESDARHRPTLEKYDQVLLDQLISIAASATIVCYAIYTLWPKTVAKFGTHSLGFTVPFVIFGVFRYLDLVYRHKRGGRPERILLTDLPLLLDVALYGGTVVLIFSLHL